MGKHWQEFVDESLLLSEEGIGIAYGASEDTPDNIARLGIARQLTVSDRECYRSQMVCYHAHGDVYIGVDAVGLARETLYLFDDGLKDVCIIVGVLALKRPDKTLKAHAGVYDVHWQRLKGSVSLAVELHEDNIPYLYHLGIIFVDQQASGRLGLLLWGTAVEMYLRAGATWTRITHLPEVVMLVAIDNMIGWYMLCPVTCGFVVASQMLLRRALEDSNIEIFGVQVEYVDEIFPCVVYSSLLEIVTKAPIAKHLKHRMMVGVMADFLQVIMLSADAEALLRVGAAARLGVTCTEYDVLPLVHTGVGKHQGRVILDYHRSRGHNSVSLAGEKSLKRLSYLICCHHDFFFLKQLQSYEFLSTFAANTYSNYMVSSLRLQAVRRAPHITERYTFPSA